MNSSVLSLDFYHYQFIILHGTHPGSRASAAASWLGGSSFVIESRIKTVSSSSWISYGMTTEWGGRQDAHTWLVSHVEVLGRGGPWSTGRI